MPNLVGIGLSQVPTNSMLGGLAYQDPEHASIKNLDLKNLSQINSEIADTAVDVFVYDTRKDSDGGAWRKRTQNTSWYNETLNTATRGSRKEFPAVAVIVADVSTDKVTIYDGDDPDLPMWMVCSAQNPRGILGWATTNTTDMSLAAMNGIMVVGTNDSGVIFKFIEDYVEIMYSSANYFITSSRIIAGRNDVVSYNGLTGMAVRVFVIVTYRIYDVAMTVLPNAPIDPSTGLPIPTIAVATDSGISFILDDGTVVDNVRSTNDVTSITFDKDNSAIFAWGTTSGAPRHITRLTTNVWNVASSSSSLWPNSYFSGYNEGLGNSAANFESAASGVVTVANSGRHFGIKYATGNTNDRLGILHPRNLTNYADQNLSAFISSSYNTGYMHGNIKGAFMSDTDTTNVTGSELITNGTFDSNTTGWTSHNGATITHTTPSAAGIDTPATDGRATPSSAGIIKIVSNGGASGAYQSFTTVVGKTYTASFLAYQVSYGSNYVYIGTSINGNQNFDFYDEWDQSVNNNWASGSATFTATATTTYISLVPSQVSGRVLYMDQISVRLANPDRSINDKGLAVFGTVAKSAVATGAELVGYSGWSNNDYLLQPYNTAFNWGTNPWSLSFWINPNSGIGPLIGHGDDSNDGFLVDIHTTGGNYYVDPGYLGNSNGFARNNSNNGGLLYNSVWNHVTIIDKNQRFYVYVNGVLHNFIWDHGAVNWTTRWSNPITRIGGRTTGSPNFSQSGSGNIKLALVRFSQSEPSPEQIKKMYNDEKHLFHENAKATLYGSSDAVTALAFDDTTNLLHVGTSAGRSEFQGLRRINNTTTAVTTAISASNGFVAEQ